MTIGNHPADKDGAPVRSTARYSPLGLFVTPIADEESVAYIDDHTRTCGNENILFSEWEKVDIFRKINGVASKTSTPFVKTPFLQGAASELEIIHSNDVYVPELMEN